MTTTTTATATSKAKALTVTGLQRWAHANRAAVLAMLAARNHAAAERVRVDAYIAPVFASFAFPAGMDGEAIIKPGDLYLCEDAELCAAFYGACDTAHRANGFTGEAGYCPALIADHAAIQTENVVVRSMEHLLGVEVLHLDHRAELLAMVTEMVQKLSK